MKRALIIILGLALAGGGSAQAGPGPGLGSGQGCKAQCIKSALVWSKGTSAKIRVRTDTAAFIKIRVSDQAPWPATPAPHFYTVDASSFSGALKTDWTTTLTGLDAGTVYHIVVEAQDANGRTAFRQGTFTTLKRNVLITFTHIKIVSDAEPNRRRNQREPAVLHGCQGCRRRQMSSPCGPSVVSGIVAQPANAAASRAPCVDGASSAKSAGQSCDR